MIALTEANTALAEWARKAQREGTTFIVLDDATPIASLVPTTSRRCTGADLAKTLQKNKLSAEEASSWARDLKEGRAALCLPEDKWQ